MNITKSNIIESISQNTSLKKLKSAQAFETLMEIMKQTLVSGEDMMISGFGRFHVMEKKERRGRNPATGDDMMLQPRKVVGFKCSGKLRDRINSRKQK